MDLSLTMNLAGLQLIEASAGTGKTYTLTTLYLRLLLERRLDPSHILVVTFTEAATEALRERIRERIGQALTFCTAIPKAATNNNSDDMQARKMEMWGTPPHPPSDPVVARIIASISANEVQHLLLEAQARMDEASVYTIHSFCQRMLQEYAFETGVDFSAQLTPDELPLRLTAAADVWRRRLADATVEDAAWICGKWTNDPAALLMDMAANLGHDNLRMLPPIDPKQLQQELAQFASIIQKIRIAWQNWGVECRELLLNSTAINRKTYNTAAIQKLVAEMDIFAATGGEIARLPDKFALLQSTTLNKYTNKGKVTPQHPFFALCATMQPEQLVRTHKLRQALWYQQARAQIRTNLAALKSTQGLWSFDDLLTHLDCALMDPFMGTSLATAIRKRFPVAMIDEFQDTDPQQYRIFRNIYGNQPDCGLLGGVGAGASPTSLILIGDPKQAIYSFRGADIFTYMQAKTDALRNQTDGERADVPHISTYTLATNWRSSQGLITAVNTLFNNVATPFLYAHIPFQPVKASPKPTTPHLLIDNQPPTPLQFWLLQSGLGDVGNTPTPHYINQPTALADIKNH